MIVQGEVYGATPNVVVALCLTAAGPADDVRPRVEPDADNGLREVSDIAADLLVTVPRTKIGRFIGRLAPDDVRRVEISLLVLLGFAE